MKINRISISRNPISRNLSVATLLAAIAALAPPIAAPSPARAADPKEVSKDIIAVQIRRQGFPCVNPQSATREGDATKYDDAVWVLKCDNATYKVQLIPNMAAKVERLP
jgi:hypothetical protein